MRQRDRYWKWYADHWKTDEVVKAVEGSSQMAADPGGLTTR